MLRELTLVVIATVVSCAGCTMEMTGNGNGNSNSNGDGGGISMRIEIPAGMMVGPVELTPGEQDVFSDSFTLPIQMSFDTITVDMESTIAGTQITRNAAKGAKVTQAATREVFYRIGPASEADSVCITGVLYGPFMVAIDENAQPMSVDPPSSQLTNQSVQVINSGAFAICVQATPMNNSTLNLDKIAIDVTMGGGGNDNNNDNAGNDNGNDNGDGCGELANFAGTWTGSFTCSYSCGSGFAGDISLTVTQDGESAFYVDDRGGRFDGTVCGNVFSFSNDDGDETETGRMTITGAGTAVKTSSYRGNSPPFCSGDCEDTLIRN